MDIITEHGNYSVDYNSLICKYSIDRWKDERLPLDEFSKDDWESAIGIGAITGFQNLKSILIKGCRNFQFVEEILNIISLPSNYEWVVRWGMGENYQILFFSGDLPYKSYFDERLVFMPYKDNDINFKSLEVIYNDLTILPPSSQDSGSDYIFISGDAPSRPPTKVDSEKIARVIDKFCIIYNTYQPTKLSFSDNFNSPEYIYKLIPRKSEEPFYGLFSTDHIYAFIDVETNGLPKVFANVDSDPLDFPEIIQLAITYCDTVGKRILSKYIYIYPDSWQLKPDALDFLGIDMDLLNQRGVRLKNNSAIEVTAYDLYKLLKYGTGYIIGHNLDFDLNCLKAFSARLGQLNGYETAVEIFEEGILMPIEYSFEKVCTMKSTTEFCGIKNDWGGYKYPKLGELYNKLFNEQLPGAHNASNDALNTAKCYWKLRDLGFDETLSDIAYRNEIEIELD